LQLPNVIGFTFGVIQMGLYALYRNATPKVLAKDVSVEKEVTVDNTVKVDEHVVTISKLGAPAIELKTDEGHPVESPPTEEANQQDDKVQTSKGRSNNADEA
jgi:solute carrier family 50 protein (sugar transporter)